jgi:hypothetical protein
VILKESELDCDVATAIQRIRDNEETARHRILVIAPDVGDESGAPRTHVPPMPTTLAQVARRSECDVLAQANQRVVPLLACLERFLDEASVAWKELDDSIEEAPRARLRNQSHTLREILDWAGAVADDLRRESAGIESGRRTIDTRNLLFEMAGQIETLFPAVRVQLLPGGASHCIGRAAELAEAFYLALALTAQRIGGKGTIAIEIDEARDHLVHRIWGQGQVCEIEARESIERFRNLVVDRHHGRITPDVLGPHAAGMTIHLPIHPA